MPLGCDRWWTPAESEPATRAPRGSGIDAPVYIGKHMYLLLNSRLQGSATNHLLNFLLPPQPSITLLDSPWRMGPRTSGKPSATLRPPLSSRAASC